MPKPAEKTISSLEQYVACIEELPAGPHWFRGCGKAVYPLRPTLYRHVKKLTLDERLELEAKLLTWFRQRSVPYLERELREVWDHLFFMQHMRIPTRLLDWTESPFVGLFFALQEEADAKNNRAAVWVLRPDAWNRWALRDISFAGGVLSPDDDEVRAYAPRTVAARLRVEPIALHGTHNSARIAAQRGAFVAFGRNMKPMEAIFAEEGYPRDALTKLVVRKSDRAPLLKSLLRAGVTDSVVFPDLEGLAAEAKRHFGFEV